MTGKSTLLRSSFPDALTIDLLDPSEYRLLLAHPEDLAARISAKRTDSKIVVIDEVQKIPELLDVVHSLIERDKSLRFVLTGSSARKLKRSDTNLLAGRVSRAELFPLVSAELEKGSEHYRTLIMRGGLPSVVTSEAPFEDLNDYVGTYLKEEILAEGLSRNIGAFARFLETAALCNGELVQFANIANDAGIPARTAQDHFRLLEDTLLGILLPAYRKTKTRKAIAAAKFYFFDPGVANALMRRTEIAPRSPEYGRGFEHLLFCELRACLSYARSQSTLAHWRSTSKLEVDFIIERSATSLLAIEAKATTRVGENDLRGLRAFREDFPKMRAYVVCEESAPRDTEDGILIRPMSLFLEEMWSEGLDHL